MPNKFREIFNEQWFLNHIRKKENGVFEIRCSIDKIAYSGSGKTINIATENFICDIVAKSKNKKPHNEKVKFNDFAEQWFKLIKKPMVKPKTYSNYYDVYTVHIVPYFKNGKIDGYTAMQIQPLILKLIKADKYKTATMVKILLSQIFESALNERLIEFNPMNGVQLLKREGKKGTALLIEEEFFFLTKIADHCYKLAFALLLFCGMRRGELKSAKIQSGFIVVADGKLKAGRNQTYRRIPITPMLAPYIEGVSEKEFNAAVSVGGDILTRAFKKICPDHHLHELRHTFITRCQECGVPREVVSVWAGHAPDKTMTSTVYTHFSDEFMTAEGSKVDYFNRLYNR